MYTNMCTSKVTYEPLSNFQSLFKRTMKEKYKFGSFIRLLRQNNSHANFSADFKQLK